MKIFPKTFFYTLALLVLIALLANGLIYTLMPKDYIRKKEADLERRADELSKALSGAEREDIMSLMSRFAAGGQTDMIVKVGEDKYALVLWSSGMGGDGDVTTSVTVTTDADAAGGSGGDVAVSKIETEGGLALPSFEGIYGPAQTLRAERSFTMAGEAGTLSLAMTLAPVDEAMGVIGSLLPISILLCVVIAVVFSLLYARSMTRPIKAISDETSRMTRLERSARCEVKSRDEFGDLAANVNGLYENLLSTIDSLEGELKKVSAAEKAKTDFLRAASHELKTPATAVSVILDNMILGVGKYKNHEEWLPRCRELVDDLTDKLREILDASRLQTEEEPPATESIETFCAEVLEPYLMIARAKGLNLYVDWSGAFPVTAPPKLLEKALSNIFSNAVLYTGAGGRCAIYCKENSLVIENECTPVPAAELPRLYEPFYRPDLSRSRETGGNGLGLYIVDTVLRFLGLSYRFEPMDAPEGMRFTIDF
ncbi:Putative two-component histidine kinase (modular protein) [uncultured Eubacteriales bacterium]|uniref:histidine kinase n=1 Tax=uncultured Eubacteriales bacterium TaxID=172733 RepID=A0A212JHY3_9FIRM|nr:Putative two-component histidine kinase (modular protein) [uncultured Eubacteriales bacterium]